MMIGRSVSMLPGVSIVVGYNERRIVCGLKIMDSGTLNN